MRTLATLLGIAASMAGYPYAMTHSNEFLVAHILAHYPPDWHQHLELAWQVLLALGIFLMVRTVLILLSSALGLFTGLLLIRKGRGRSRHG